MEVMPVMEVRAVIDVAISVAHAAATEDRRGTKAAAMDRHAATSEPTAVEAAASKAAASPAAKPAASTTAKTTTAAAAMTSMPDFGRQIVGCKFR